ncbi:MAG: aspartate carbamoyltransferase catalytic subunit [Bacteroidetes bacterium]|nr:aspartate carbamoyltransferase catalytic subunit [Bacteroidota bacterium]
MEDVVQQTKMRVLQHRHLLGLSTYSADEIQLILSTAREFREVLERPIKRVPTLLGTTIANLFFEPSTRTRVSFELAAKRLSADLINFGGSGSSLSKGESLRDTVQNIEAMKVDMVVIRHSSPGAAHFLTRCIKARVINAGDGAHEHPTQALLDLLTISERYESFSGLRVSIIGDIAHSRVARSNIFALTTLGAEVTVCGPPTLMPLHVESLGVRVVHNLDDALRGCDVAMALRIQRERLGASLVPSMREYHVTYGLNGGHMAMHPDMIVLHPGPVNRGVELDDEVADHERTAILDQVINGVAVRMAVIYLLAPGAGE